MNKQVRKAIIPVAGFGTRFLPATKVQPKEMLPIVDKPVVHYLVEEAAQAGIEQIMFVINSNKHVIGDYFARDLNLENFLKKQGKKDLLSRIQNIHTLAHFLYVHQDEPLGSGDAVLRARSFIGDEPFAIFYADDVIVYPPGKPALGQLIHTFQTKHTSVMGLVRVPHKDVSKYGVIKGEAVEKRLYKVHRIIEKPNKKEAPSNLVSVGRFIVTPDIFEHIQKSRKTKGEIYLTSALGALAKEGAMYGLEIDGNWYDCGNKFEYWRANFEIGLRSSEVRKDAERYLKGFFKKTKF